ncbi:MAG TPA: protein-L-isoaspartate(D-aspartate) O-methyltransferase [Myxococcota bacterium]|nr:protein-L-isoaspartate(D-aspartate) O-methyltransferase [Myxococcota bacterium]
MDEDGAIRERARMVERQLAGRGIRDARVLAAMRELPRHRFVSPEQRAFAHDDRALPIGRGQTISQPLMVALMLQEAAIGPDARVLEVGAGSGYLAALLGRLAREVFALELDPELAAKARARLAELGIANVELRAGDGSRGWREHAPFDAILVSAAAERIPPALEAQLAPGGRLLAPVGPRHGSQSLVRVTRRGAEDWERRELCEVQFVPLVGATESSR